MLRSRIAKARWKTTHLSKMHNVESIRKLLTSKLIHKRFVRDKSGANLVELVGCSFKADEPAIFGTPDEDYINREIEWYETQSLKPADMLGKTPAIWEQISSDKGEINSNYGYLIYSKENGKQYWRVRDLLKNDPNTRRASMIYQRPTMHEDFDRDGMSDFICTNAVQYFIRDDKLHAVVQMRSNDAYFGYRNDYAWQRYVQTNLANDVGVEAGDLIWNAASLHLYERHFKLVKTSWE